MLTKMLKHTVVLFVLMAFFVVATGVLSEETSSSSQPVYNPWGSPISNKKCKGEFKDGTDPDCADIPAADCATTKGKYTIISESEGCVTEGYGFTCWERIVSWPEKTTDCMTYTRWEPNSDGIVVQVTKCKIDNTNVSVIYKDFKDCKDS